MQVLSFGTGWSWHTLNHWELLKVKYHLTHREIEKQ